MIKKNLHLADINYHLLSFPRDFIFKGVCFLWLITLFLGCSSSKPDFYSLLQTKLHTRNQVWLHKVLVNKFKFNSRLIFELKQNRAKLEVKEYQGALDWIAKLPQFLNRNMSLGKIDHNLHKDLHVEGIKVCAKGLMLFPEAIECLVSLLENLYQTYSFSFVESSILQILPIDLGEKVNTETQKVASILFYLCSFGSDYPSLHCIEKMSGLKKHLPTELIPFYLQIVGERKNLQSSTQSSTTMSKEGRFSVLPPSIFYVYTNDSLGFLNATRSDDDKFSKDSDGDMLFSFGIIQSTRDRMVSNDSTGIGFLIDELGILPEFATRRRLDILFELIVRHSIRGNKRGVEKRISEFENIIKENTVEYSPYGRDIVSCLSQNPCHLEKHAAASLLFNMPSSSEVNRAGYFRRALIDLVNNGRVVISNNDSG